MNPLAVIEAHVAVALRIGVFGSFGRGEARDDSDVDVYVEFDDAKRCYEISSRCTNGWRNCSVGAWISSRTSRSPKARPA